MRPLKVADRGLCQLTGEHADPAGRPRRRVAERCLGHEAPRINRKEFDVRPEGRIRGGAQLRLVIHAVELQATREIHERLLLWKRAKHRDRRLER